MVGSVQAEHLVHDVSAPGLGNSLIAAHASYIDTYLVGRPRQLSNGLHGPIYQIRCEQVAVGDGWESKLSD